MLMDRHYHITMKEVRELIREKVKDGSYFEDAKEFHFSKYVYPFVLSTQYTLFALVLIVATYYSVTTFIRDYAGEQLSFLISAQDEVKYYPKLKPLSSTKEPIEASVARYLVTRFVNLWEGYDPIDYATEFKGDLEQKIKSISSQEVYFQYLDFINPEKNSESPTLKYKNKSQRYIKITNIKWFEDTIDGYGAYVDVIAAVQDKAKDFNENIFSGSDIEKFRIKLSYRMSNLEKIAKSKDKFVFQVMEYKYM
jgi:type IV secretion system protein VirB8